MIAVLKTNGLKYNKIDGSVAAMVRISECFECGAKEGEKKLIYSQNNPVLCEDCYKKKNS